MVLLIYLSGLAGIANKEPFSISGAATRRDTHTCTIVCIHIHVCRLG